MPRGEQGGSSGGGGGKGRGMGQGGGPGRQGRFAAGPGGSCACPKCGKTMPHQRGIPCVQVTCPECGTAMTRHARSEDTARQ